MCNHLACQTTFSDDGIGKARNAFHSFQKSLEKSNELKASVQLRTPFLEPVLTTISWRKNSFFWVDVSKSGNNPRVMYGLDKSEVTVIEFLDSNEIIGINITNFGEILDCNPECVFEKAVANVGNFEICGETSMKLLNISKNAPIDKIHFSVSGDEVIGVLSGSELVSDDIREFAVDSTRNLKIIFTMSRNQDNYSLSEIGVLHQGYPPESKTSIKIKRIDFSLDDNHIESMQSMKAGLKSMKIDKLEDVGDHLIFPLRKPVLRKQ